MTFDKTIPRLIIFLCGYVLLLCIAATIFLAIEGDVESEQIAHITSLKRNFLDRHPCVSYGELQTLLAALETSTTTGVSASDNFTRWDFGHSLFFVVSAVTTVGYGQLTPESQSGKLFTIVFSLIGIPLTLIVISALVDRLLVLTGLLLQWLERNLDRSVQAFKIKLLHLIIVLTIAVIFCILIPAAVYKALEPEWNYVEAVYFCFNTLTTTGFGDFTPGTSKRFLQENQTNRFTYMIGSSVYVFLGLTYMMLALTVFYNIPQLNLPDLFAVDQNESDLQSEVVGSTVSL